MIADKSNPVMRVMVLKPQKPQHMDHLLKKAEKLGYEIVEDGGTSTGPDYEFVIDAPDGDIGYLLVIGLDKLSGYLDALEFINRGLIPLPPIAAVPG